MITCICACGAGPGTAYAQPDCAITVPLRPYRYTGIVSHPPNRSPKGSSTQVIKSWHRIQYRSMRGECTNVQLSEAVGSHQANSFMKSLWKAANLDTNVCITCAQVHWEGGYIDSPPPFPTLLPVAPAAGSRLTSSRGRMVVRRWNVPSSCPKPDPGTVLIPVASSSLRQYSTSGALPSFLAASMALGGRRTWGDEHVVMT